MSSPTGLDLLLKPILPHLAADGLTELVINRPGELGAEIRRAWSWHSVPQLDQHHLRMLANAVANHTRQSISEQNPICSSHLPDGSRIQIVIPPAVGPGTVSVTIRKPSPVTFSLQDLARGGLFARTRMSRTPDRDTVDAELLRLLQDGDPVAFLERAVQARKNILISGPTGSGKTTISKALIPLIPSWERLITIEDTFELEVPHQNVVRMLYSKDGHGRSKAGPKQLLESSLRMRPDRILLQELRDGVAWYYLRNVNSGHPGSITTVHANSTALAFEQLTLLVKESEGGRDLARDDIRALLHILVDVVIQCQAGPDGYAVTEIDFDPDRQHSGRLAGLLRGAV
ncbi:MAG: P-type DNA transfer ATPase VirB11 [Inquilinus sp.]|uniref:P-type DNA transfer ATPase VirB11 n=1 Tax=Inquilinus sp. TaxID=1932117 RepID=UPI003F3A0A71